MQVRSRLARLKNSRFVRSVGVLMSGTAMASALGALTLPVVSRLYTPSEFGEFALISSIASIAAALCAFGFQAAVVKAAREGEARDLIRLGLGATMIFIGTTAVAALVIGPFLGSWQLEIPYQLAVLLVALLAVLTNVNSYLEYYANRLGRDRVLFVNSVIAALATVLISIPLGIAGLGAIGLVAGSVGALLLTVAQMMWRLRLVSRGEPSDLRGTLRSNWPFVWFQYPSDLIGDLV